MSILAPVILQAGTISGCAEICITPVSRGYVVTEISISVSDIHYNSVALRLNCTLRTHAASPLHAFL